MNDSLLTRIWIFYRDGFREMTLGRTLWTIIPVSYTHLDVYKRQMVVISSTASSVISSVRAEAKIPLR